MRLESVKFTLQPFLMTEEANAASSKPVGFREELTDFWRALPNKALFFFLFAAWLMLFHFFGNSTLGYVNTPSLFGWWLWVNTRGLDDLTVWEKPGRILAADEAHAWLMPFVVLGLFWWKRRELEGVSKKTWWPALGLFIAALLLHVFGHVVQQTRISLVAFFTGLYALTGLVWGARWLKASFFPYFLFAFCFPLGSMADNITFPLRMLATNITTSLVGTVLGINVIQDGTRIFDAHGTFQYEVAVACSGLRSLTAILLLSTIYGFITFKGTIKRLVMIVAAFPLAVASNVFRLATIIIAAEAFGQEAGNFVHDNSWFSLLPYLPGIGGILLLSHWLREKKSTSAPTANVVEQMV